MADEAKGDALMCRYYRLITGLKLYPLEVCMADSMHNHGIGLGCSAEKKTTHGVRRALIGGTGMFVC